MYHVTHRSELMLAFLLYRDTVGVRLLRSMGWRPGQGVGPRLSHQQKKIQKKEIKKASSKVYGCTLPGSSSTQSGGSGEDSSGDSDNDDITSMTFAPDDYDAFIVKTKDDVFGIGYKGLDKKPVLSGHVQLFEPSFLGMQEKKKKVAIWGQVCVYICTSHKHLIMILLL